MSGKFIVAAFAVGLSSASAATVGFVYTRLVQTWNMEAAISKGEAAANPGPLKSAVVLNASGGFFGSFADSPADSDAAACPVGADSLRCGAGSHASDKRVNILGHTVIIPPIWLGGDSENQYSNEDNRFDWFGDEPRQTFDFKRRFRLRRAGLDELSLSPQSDGESEDLGPPQSQGGSGNNAGSQASEQVFSYFPSDRPYGLEKAAPSVLVFVSPSLNVSLPEAAIPSLAPIPEAPSLENTGSADGGSSSGSGPSDTVGSAPLTVSPALDLSRLQTRVTAPEPSTWIMLLAGLAPLGIFKRRQIATAVKSAMD